MLGEHVRECSELEVLTLPPSFPSSPLPSFLFFPCILPPSPLIIKWILWQVLEGMETLTLMEISMPILCPRCQGIIFWSPPRLHNKPKASLSIPIWFGDKRPRLESDVNLSSFLVLSYLFRVSKLLSLAIREW